MRRWTFSLLVLFCLSLSAAAAPSSDDNVATPAEAFAAMRRSFQSAKARGLHARYQFHLSPPEGGDWCISVDDGACLIRQGEIPGPDVTFECTGADWVKMCNNTLGGFHAWITGRMRMQGSQALARKLDELFP